LPGVFQETVDIGGISGIAQREVEQVRLGRIGTVEPQQGVSEHARRIVQIVGRKYQARGTGIDPLAQQLDQRTFLLRHACRIEVQLRIEPLEARREGAAGELLVLADSARGEEGAQRGFDFGLRIGFTVDGEEEVIVVDLGSQAAAESVCAVVQQYLPGSCFRQALRAYLFEQAVEINAIGVRIGSPGFLGRKAKACDPQ
jgi:hypothetical protein